jgi:hypothetical protein
MERRTRIAAELNPDLGNRGDDGNLGYRLIFSVITIRSAVSDGITALEEQQDCPTYYHKSICRFLNHPVPLFPRSIIPTFETAIT